MHYKSLFVSDIHLGTKQCKVEYLLKFLHDNTFDNIFLIGDIIDIHALSHKWYWHKDHNTFIQKMLKLSRKGETQITFLIGNHDEAIREFIKDDERFSFGDIKVVDQYIYKTVKGQHMLLIHGDQFDGAIRSMGFLYFLGDRAYDAALIVNTIYNNIRGWFGLKYWSVSSYLKTKVKGAISFINSFDELIVRKCMTEGYDGLIYGHTHTPSMKTIKTKKIYNTGDSVENCTCIVETIEGEFQLIRMTDNTIISKE